MATVHDSPYRSVDARGRALTMTEEQVRARAESIARGLDALVAEMDSALARDDVPALADLDLATLWEA